jgi:hypothetical protein
MRWLELILEIFGWLQIVAGTTIAGGLVGSAVYIKWSNETGKFICLITLCIGFISGAVWATVIWRKYGTIEWLSRIRRIS